MQKSFLKILTLVLVIGLNWGGVSAVGYTLGMFNDTEYTSENTFTAGTLDFTLKADKFDFKKTSINLKPGDIIQKNINIIPKKESNPFKYYTESSGFKGDKEFCNSLKVDAKVLDSEMYSGALKELLTEATTTLPSWSFEFGMGDKEFQNKECKFDIVYNSWQTRHDYPTYKDGGFSDTEKVSNTISSWGLRLNKVYYDVAPDRGEEKDNEWVEIFNQTNVPLDISGWKICDDTSCNKIPTADPIPAMGYGVITATSTTWGYWFVPSEVVKIVLSDNEIGNGLGNDGDKLYLKRPDGVVVDKMNWQSNTHVWSPGAVDVAEGNLLARTPNGYDTNQASDWVELTPPDVDLIYPDEDGSYTWYWTKSYEIKWTASNPNGDDADLAIDLYYIKDVNGDSEISDDDTRHEIAKSTTNDGSYLWTVPKGFVGYIWIELVATGPENPMLNSKTISGDIWDPIPVFLWEEDPQAIIDALINPEESGGETIVENETILTTTEIESSDINTETDENETTESNEESEDLEENEVREGEENEATEGEQPVVATTTTAPSGGSSYVAPTQETSDEEEGTEQVEEEVNSCVIETEETENIDDDKEVNSCIVDVEDNTEEEVREIEEDITETDEPEEGEVTDIPLILEPAIEPDAEPEIEEETTEDEPQDIASNTIEEDVPVASIPEESIIPTDEEETPTEE